MGKKPNPYSGPAPEADPDIEDKKNTSSPIDPSEYGDLFKARPAVPKRDSIKKRTIRNMKQLGVYNVEFTQIIDIYCGLLHQYLEAEAEFEYSGRQYETETAAGNPKKSAVISTMENLRKDILAYSDRLGLNPKGRETVKTTAPKESALMSALRDLSNV